MKGAIALIVIGLIVIAGIVFFFLAVNKDVTQSDLYSGNGSENDLGALVTAPPENGQETGIGTEPETQSESQEFMVDITSSGFSPKALEISQGDTVTWTNKDSASSWPASNNHPTHNIYPGFDASRGLRDGESYSFTFDKVGTWGYHDHLSLSHTGTIIVN